MMINATSKSGNLHSYLKNTSQVVAGTLRQNGRPLLKQKKIVVEVPQALSSISLNKLLARRDVRVVCGPSVPQQIRLAHTDIVVPDFSHYRKPSTLDPTKPHRDGDISRKSFAYLVSGGLAVGSIYIAKQTVHVFVSSMSASADVLALSSIEVNLNDIPEGKSVTFKWRGKPLFIRHRDADEIKREESVPLSELRDPQHDKERVQQSEWLIVVGVCTHLGCVPIANAGEFGGYYCPCHGSHYDASGRIRKGPAPLNLEVPPYQITPQNLLIVG